MTSFLAMLHMESQKNNYRFVWIPPGDPATNRPALQYVTDHEIKYQQNGRPNCLSTCIASTLHIFEYVDLAEKVYGIGEEVLNDEEMQYQGQVGQLSPASCVLKAV